MGLGWSEELACEVEVTACSRAPLQTAQAAAKARDMLEYASEEVRIPRDLAGTAKWSVQLGRQ